MNIQELETVSRLALPIKFFVINNSGYASIRASQTNYFQSLTGADHTSGLTLPEWSKVAFSFGIPFHRVSAPEDLTDGVQAILDQPGPGICEIVVIADEPREPRVASVIRADGSMVSRPLEDLYPFLARDELKTNMVIPLIEDGI
jgi:acetolactate synthase-1/2/3 large subunit